MLRRLLKLRRLSDLARSFPNDRGADGTSGREEADKIQRSSGRLWRLRKHPAQIQSRLQIDCSSINISGLFNRDVEGVNCKSPVIFFALFGTQFSAQSNRISYRR
jgi:hypothetical protein